MADGVGGGAGRDEGMKDHAMGVHAIDGMERRRGE